MDFVEAAPREEGLKVEEWMGAQYFMELKALQGKEDREGLTVRILKQAARRRYRARRHRRELQLAIHKAAADYMQPWMRSTPKPGSSPPRIACRSTATPSAPGSASSVDTGIFLAETPAKGAGLRRSAVEAGSKCVV